MEECKTCNGVGYTVEHNLPITHSPDGKCLDCPVQVQCEDCEATGLRSQLTNSG